MWDVGVTVVQRCGGSIEKCGSGLGVQMIGVFFCDIYLILTKQECMSFMVLIAEDHKDWSYMRCENLTVRSISNPADLFRHEFILWL